MCTLMGKPSTFMSSLETTNICTLMGNPDFCTMISICTLIGKHQHLYCHGKPLVCVLLRGTMLAQGMLHRVYYFSSNYIGETQFCIQPFLVCICKEPLLLPTNVSKSVPVSHLRARTEYLSTVHPTCEQSSVHIL